MAMRLNLIDADIRGAGGLGKKGKLLPCPHALTPGKAPPLTLQRSSRTLGALNFKLINKEPIHAQSSLPFIGLWI